MNEWVNKWMNEWMNEWKNEWINERLPVSLRGSPWIRPVREGVSTDSLKFHPGPPCPTLLRPAGGPPPKRPYGHLGVCPPAGRAACGCLLSPWTPLTVRACLRSPNHHAVLMQDRRFRKFSDKFRACNLAFSTLTVKLEVLEVPGWSSRVSETITFDLKKKFVEIESGNL
jgi:hypothetical protein